MFRVAVISPIGTELDTIRHQLKNPMRWLVKEISNIELVASELTRTSFHLIIIRFAEFGPMQVDKLKKISSRLPGVALLASSPEVDPSARYDLATWAQSSKLNARVILEPNESKDLAQIVEKMVNGEPSSQRMHIRKNRKDEAEVLDTSGQRMKAKFLDFSQMGAKLQIFTNGFSRPKFTKNQRVSLIYPSHNNPGKNHHVEAVVIWEGPSAGVVESLMFGGAHTVGIRFIAFS